MAEIDRENPGATKNVGTGTLGAMAATVALRDRVHGQEDFDNSHLGGEAQLFGDDTPRVVEEPDILDSEGEVAEVTEEEDLKYLMAFASGKMEDIAAQIQQVSLTLQRRVGIK